MATTLQKWLIGCGVGCALIVVAIVVLVGGAALFIRDRFQPVKEAAESRQELIEKLGAPEAYAPPPDGAVQGDRIEAFLSIRDVLENAQTTLDAGLADFDPERLSRKKQSFGEVLGMLNDLSNLIKPIGGYVDRRNEALLGKRMSLGEYLYIYTISYYSWLGHAPEEGPAILTRRRRRNENSSDPSTFSPEALRRQYRRLILRLMRNQLDGIKITEETKWRRTLEQEIDRIDRDFDRVAWRDNLPAQIQESLEPFRERLEAHFHRSSNCLELLTLEESGQVQWGF